MASTNDGAPLAERGAVLQLKKSEAESTASNQQLSIPANVHHDNCGARPGEWDAWRKSAQDDLLPVVADPNAKISEFSKVKDIGKTPSDFNRRGEMRGFPDWTSHKATDSDIEKWRKEPRYGISLQTRRYRAIDVDIEDFDEAHDAMLMIKEFLGEDVPIRSRSNSCKFAVLVDVPGDFRKRRFLTKTPGDAIELLATGQQLVVSALHPSGVRYEWKRSGEPCSIPAEDIPKITVEHFELLWKNLNYRFGSEESVTVRAGLTPTKKRQLADINDRLVDFMEDRGWIKDIDRSGRVDITCPFEADHTTDSGDSATSYFPAGVGDIPVGHFKCQHSHCAHRTDKDYKDAIGWTIHGFEEITDLPTDETPSPIASVDELFADLALNENDVSAMADAEFLVDNLIVRGSLHAFVAPANGGKTTLFVHLCEELAAGGMRIFYVNADANPTDLKRQYGHAKHHGYTVIAPDAKPGMGPKDIVERFQLMNKNGADLNNVLIVLDTLKKFSNMIDKKQMRAFLALMRGLSTKGATICMLAHTNKRTEDNGQHIFEGTGDLRNDVDNLIYLEGEKDATKGIQTITTRPDKVRANFKPASWVIDLDTRQVQQATGVLHVMGDELRTVLELAKRAITNGAQKQTTLVDFIKDQTTLGEKKVRQCLLDLTKNHGSPLCITKGENNANLYSLSDSLAGFVDESADDLA